jgi:hypothetical protein
VIVVGYVSTTNPDQRNAYHYPEIPICIAAELVDWPNDWTRPKTDGIWPPQD